MRTEPTAADTFVLELPELRPVVSIDEELIASSLRSDRGRLAHLSLRVRAAEAEATRVEDELIRLQGEEVDSLARRGDVAELHDRIDDLRARADTDLLAARAAASTRMSQAIDEASELLSSASASLDHLVEAIEEDRERAPEAVVEPFVEPAAEAVVEPVAELVVVPVVVPVVETAPVFAPEPESLEVPVLLSDDELESFLDRLEARAAAEAVAEVAP